MEDFLKTDLFKVLAAVAALVVIAGAWRYLFPSRSGPLQERVRCPICGWRGTIGKYNRKCSKCGSTTLESVK